MWAAHDCAVGHDVCHVRVARAMIEHRRPYSVLFPACVALKDTVPFAELLWEFTPLGTGAQDPVNCLNETATIFLVSCVNTPVRAQERIQFLPLMVGDLVSRHLISVAYLNA